MICSCICRKTCSQARNQIQDVWVPFPTLTIGMSSVISKSVQIMRYHFRFCSGFIWPWYAFLKKCFACSTIKKFSLNMVNSAQVLETRFRSFRGLSFPDVANPVVFKAFFFIKRKCVLFYLNVYKCLSGKYRIIKEHISSTTLGVLVLCILLPHLNFLHVVFHNVPDK